MITLNEENFAKEVLTSKTPILVDFWAEWCGPCRALAPILDEVECELKEKLRIGKVNTDEEINLASKYRIQSIPTLLLFIDGEVKKEIIGAKRKSELLSTLQEYIKN